MKNFIIALFAMVAVTGCGTTTSTYTLRTSNVDVIRTHNTGALHDDEVVMIDTVQKERDCKADEMLKLPETPPTDDVGAQKYADAVDQIFADCKNRGDQGVSIATGQPLQPQRLIQPMGYGGFLYGEGNVFAGYPASMPYIIPDNRPVIPGKVEAEIEQIKVNVHNLGTSNFGHEGRLQGIEQKETP